MENGKYADKQKSFGIGTADEALLKYSVPTTLTLMVNYIYNIADQIFCGAGGRYYRNGGYQHCFSVVDSCQCHCAAAGGWLCCQCQSVSGTTNRKMPITFSVNSDVDSYRRSDDGSALRYFIVIVTLFGTTDTAYGSLWLICG